MYHFTKKVKLVFFLHLACTNCANCAVGGCKECNPGYILTDQNTCTGEYLIKCNIILYTDCVYVPHTCERSMIVTMIIGVEHFCNILHIYFGWEMSYIIVMEDVAEFTNAIHIYLLLIYYYHQIVQMLSYHKQSVQSVRWAMVPGSGIHHKVKTSVTVG